MSAPLSEQQLDDIRARETAATPGPWWEDGAEIKSGSEWVGETLDIDDEGKSTANAAFIAAARSDVPALLADNALLRAERSELNEMVRSSDAKAAEALAEIERKQVAFDRDLGQIIDERDRMHDVADRLAYAVAPIEVIGEHSSDNDPWANALALITPAAEVERLRAEQLPAWQALYGSATHTPYLIGYCTDALSAQAAALAWYRSQIETSDWLVWEPDPVMADAEWDEWFILGRYDADGIAVGTDLIVRHRAEGGAS